MVFTRALPVFLICLALPAIAQKEIITVTDWRVNTGDNATWARPDFDDSQWAKISFDMIDAYRLPTGTRWYRATFQVPDDFRGQELAIDMGAIEEVYDVYVEGVLVGRYGSWEPTPRGPFPRDLAFPLPAGLLKGAIGHIAIRQWNGGGGLLWLTFGSSGIDAFQGPPEIGARGTIEALAQLHTAAGAIQDAPWDLTDVLFLFAAAISFVLFSAQWRRVEYLYLGVFCVLQGAPTLIGSALATHESLIARSWGPVLIFGLPIVADAFSLLFLAALCPRIRRILQAGAILAAFFALVASYSFAVHSLAGTLLWQYGSSCGLAVFELAAIGALLLDSRMGSSAIAFCLLLDATGWFFFIAPGKLRITSVDAGPFRIDFPSVTGVLFVFVTLLVLYMRYRDEQARQAAIDQDLAAARRMQEQLLAGSANDTPGFAVDAVYRPAREVGGDFYRTQSLEDGSLLVIVGDVSGKGLDAAMLVAVILGSLANETHRGPASLLAYLNRAVMGRTAGGFITACCARFYPDGPVVLANAGQIAPYINGAEVDLENGLPLGISADATYTETEIKTEGTMTFVSDGVVEARDAKGELLGFERMAALMGKQAAEIAGAAQTWGQEDDITVLTVARAAMREPVTA